MNESRFLHDYVTVPFYLNSSNRVWLQKVIYIFLKCQEHCKTSMSFLWSFVCRVKQKYFALDEENCMMSTSKGGLIVLFSNFIVFLIGKSVASWLENAAKKQTLRRQRMYTRAGPFISRTSDLGTFSMKKVNMLCYESLLWRRAIFSHREVS